jgi:hypothetical protein
VYVQKCYTKDLKFRHQSQKYRKFCNCCITMLRTTLFLTLSCMCLYLHTDEIESYRKVQFVEREREWIHLYHRSNVLKKNRSSVQYFFNRKWKMVFQSFPLFFNVPSSCRFMTRRGTHQKDDWELRIEWHAEFCSKNKYWELRIEWRAEFCSKNKCFVLLVLIDLILRTPTNNNFSVLFLTICFLCFYFIQYEFPTEKN